MAGPYPLQTLACTISATGITAPPYSDILASLIASYQGIYGADVYLQPDAQDYQLLAIFAQAINDSNNATIAAYLSYSPTYAQGVGLSSQVKINGIQREAPSNSSSPLTLLGVAGTEIINGVVGDGTYDWALPALVTIPPGGEIVETAICTTPGAIQAAPGAISKIQNPQLNWQSASNDDSATPGAPVENDAQLRVRQAQSVAGPSQTVKAGIQAAVGNLVGVQTVLVYENPTNAADSNGLPAFNICVVVQGGNAVDIANAIALHKPPGVPTFGSISETVTDQAGVTSVINFQPALIVNVKAELDLKALVGYSTDIGSAAQATCAAYVTGLDLGAIAIYLTKFQAAALGIAGSTTFNLLTAKLARIGSGLAVADLPLAFDEVPILLAGNVTLVIT